MNIPDPPRALVGSIRGYFGDDGKAWLARLPQLIAKAAERWHLEIGDPSQVAGTGFVCFARDREDRDLVLKIAYPHDEHLSGVEALLVYDGRGCVRVVETAEGDTEVLMERILPGTHLYELEDETTEVRIAESDVDEGLLPHELVRALEHTVADLEALHLVR